MIKNMMILGFILLLLSIQAVSAKTGQLFNVQISPVQNGQALTITTVFNPKAPNHIYSHAGIKIPTGFEIINPGVNCTPSSNGYCLFSVSHTQPVSITLTGPSGIASVSLCLNAKGKPKSYTCEDAAVSIPHVIFITNETYDGNLSGVAGADNICNTEAHQGGSLINPSLTFKALLVTSTRYPCSKRNGVVGCGIGFANDWHLTPGDIYYNSAGALFNTVNTNSVFDGSNPIILDQTGQDPSQGTGTTSFWSGTQSIKSDTTGTAIIGWGFENLSNNVSQTDYDNNFAACRSAGGIDYGTNNSTIFGAVGKESELAGCSGTAGCPVTPLTWGNYNYFYGNFSAQLNAFLVNVFVHSPSLGCNGLYRVVCTS